MKCRDDALQRGISDALAVQIYLFGGKCQGKNSDRICPHYSYSNNDGNRADTTTRVAKPIVDKTSTRPKPKFQYSLTNLNTRQASRQLIANAVRSKRQGSDELEAMMEPEILMNQ